MLLTCPEHASVMLETLLTSALEFMAPSTSCCRRSLAYAAFLSCFVSEAAAIWPPGPAQEADRSPRGFNSWDSWLNWVTEGTLLANAAVMQSLNSSATGYQYVVADEGWFRFSSQPDRSNYSAQYLDDYGRYYPAPDRFPSTVATRSFGSLSRQIAGRGLRFGVHLVRGIP
jgi:hypothetical protein